MFLFHALPGERIDERFMFSRILRLALYRGRRREWGIA